MEFVKSGADIITTNSYALVPFHIGQDRFNLRGAELAALAGRLAREVADRSADQGAKVLVAGSLPPIFGSYEPDKFDAQKVQEYLSILVDALAPYVDVWLGETLSLIAEAQAVRLATRNTDKPLWISFTLDDTSQQNPPCLRSGESIEQAAEWAQRVGASALLFNCSSAEYMAPGIKIARDVFAAYSASPPVIGAYANAFASAVGDQPANEGLNITRKDLTPEMYAQFAKEWISLGASIVGGCCGIGCDHIRELVAQLKSLRTAHP